MSAEGASLTGVLRLAGAVLIFTGSAAVGALLAAVAGARERLRGPRRLGVYSLACAAMLIAGVGLTRSEARAGVLAFALVPLVVGFLMARMDLRRARR